MPTDADRIDAIRWLAERMGLEPDPEDGVWLATTMGRVLRLPLHLSAVLTEVLTDD